MMEESGNAGSAGPKEGGNRGERRGGMQEFEGTAYRLSRVMQKLPIGCALVQGLGRWRLISGNEEFFRTIGYTVREMQEIPSDMRDALDRHIFYKEDLNRLREEMEKAIESDEVRQCEVRIRGKSGEVRWVEMRIRFFHYEEGGPCFLLSSGDIHERKLMEEKLYLQTERYKMMEEINNEFPFEYNVPDQTISIPARSNIVLGKREEKDRVIPIEAVKRVLHPDDCGRFLHMIGEASAEERHGTLEYRVNTAGTDEKTEYAWHKISYKSVRGVNGRIVRILGRTKDVTGEHMLQDKMTRRLRQDDLTGLLNRAAIKAEVEGFLMSSPAGRHALFLVDIDNFKAINDTLGHLVGDNILVSIGKKIRGLFRGSDVIGRIGGDEFMILMKYTDLFQAKAKAQGICEAARQTYHGKDGEEVRTSCSVGIAMYGLEKESYATLFSKADAAMYKAKKAGKDQFQAAETPDALREPQPEGRGKDAGRREGESENAAQDLDFISEAFVLLSSGDDVNASLNMLMERIGRQYDLGIVSILECNREKKELIQTNCWTRGKGILTTPQFVDRYDNWDGFQSGFDERGLAYINDCYDGENVTEADKAVFRERNMHALINCRFSYSELGEGYVSFCDTEKPRIWADYEKETFLELARMLSVFVALRVQREEDQKAIRKLKKCDMLTGLYLEDAFKAIVKEELSQFDETMTYAVVYADINDFSYINDNFGHASGNELLKSFAELARKKEDSVSCRLYSDLFVTFLKDKDRETVIREVVDSCLEFSRRQKEVYTTCNIRLKVGVYFIKDKNENLDNAIENANLARKSIKSGHGAFCRVYTDSMREEREAEKKILASFQDSLEAGEFQVYVQPKFLLSELTFCGGEALVRWKTAGGEIKPPITFIPVLEKYGYVVELDFYVFEGLLRHMRKWREAGKELPVISVNFSRSHFEQDGIYQRIAALTEKYQIDPGRIEIEITESLFVTGYDLVKEEVRKLREDGFRVAIDDFGTGYSSLGMLVDIPADIVKIDKSFLNRENRKNDREFIMSMGQLIRSVKEEAIVEGIETEEQRQFLMDCGFLYGQGYLFDRPLPIGDFEEKYMK